MRAMRLPWTLLGATQLSETSRSKLRIVGLLYSIEGSPVSILWEALPVYLRLHGTSLRAIGGLRLLEFPFSLKFLWSPLIQRFGDRRSWVTGAMLVIALVVGVLPVVVCDPARATLQYAFMSSLFSLTGRLAGAVSGIGAEQWGYGAYFVVTFLYSIPGLVLVPFVASWLPARPDLRAAVEARE